MRAVVTRVTQASVTIDGVLHAEISGGFLVLLGVGTSDGESEALKIADKICGLRVFEDNAGKMNLAPKDVGAEILLISQFTLYADCRQRRPGFSNAANPDSAKPLYELCARECVNRGFTVKTGVFGADMKVFSVNDGPVTLILDTNEL